MRAPSQHPSLKIDDDSLQLGALSASARARVGDHEPAPKTDEPPPSREPAEEASKPKSGSSGGMMELAGWDDDDDQLEIALDLGSEPPPKKAKPAPKPPPSADGGSAPAPPSSSGAPPSRAHDGGTPDGAQPQLNPTAAVVALQVDIRAVRLLAEYGEPPGNILGAPKYAWTVHQRKKELSQMLEDQRELHGETTKLLKEDLASVVDSIADRAGSTELETIMAPVTQSERMIADRRKTMESAVNKYTGEFQALDDELEREKDRRKEAAKEREAAQIVVEDAAQKRGRVAAELKRLENELRSAHDEASKAAGDDDYAPPEHARRIKQLEAEQDKMKEMLVGREDAYQAAKRVLRQRASALREVDARIGAVHARESSAEKQASHARELGIESLKQAHLARLDAYVRVLERIEQELPELLTDSYRKRIETARASVGDADRELEKYRRAIDCYDSGWVNKGIAVVVVIVVAVLAVLVSAAQVN